MSVTEQPEKRQATSGEIEISLNDIIQFLKDSVRTVAIATTVCAVIGILYALSLHNEYTASVRVMPEVKSGTSGGGFGELRSLAGLAGVNLDNGGASETIRPDLYPDVLQSTPFTIYLLRQSVSTDEQSTSSLQTYMTNEAKKGWFGKSDNEKTDSKQKTKAIASAAVELTEEQEALGNELAKRISVTIDKKNGIITLSSMMPDPKVAATTASKTLEYLSKYVSDYRTGKARQQVDFLVKQTNEARRRYKAAEFALYNYRDKNRSLFLNTAKIEEQRLQADYQLAQEIYTNLSRQLEQSRIKVQEEEPVFQVLEPARVPSHKSGPKRTILIIGFAFFGVIMGLIIFLIRRIMS
ncbi:GNVR domain-containing protein [Spirosoma sp. KUDC1026]|uniref:GNVR domain-containing protein n=1 Tax=Spirosoma sp. KUDC1026 TaxID=2745947 RepID=UPI00159B9661|nr:GNVR domain-containing protein [Spirosoma sp. KUDC1026]QKZ11930.1 lipopolysaccharide biosynthesis protein [Spirosoma sp. KUDC1026]